MFLLFQGLQSVQLRFPLPPTEGQSSEEVDRIVHAMLDGDEQLKGVTVKTIPQRENLLYSKLMMTSTTADGQVGHVVVVLAMKEDLFALSPQWLLFDGTYGQCITCISP